MKRTHKKRKAEHAGRQKRHAAASKPKPKSAPMEAMPTTADTKAETPEQSLSESEQPHIQM